ncbi:MAG: TolC family protein, partial [Candidatus Methylomirabilales bacterium]
MKRNRHLVAIGTFLLLMLLVGAKASSSAQGTGSAPMDLKQLIDEGLKNNPEIVAARRAWEAAETRIAQATSLDDPEFTYQAWSVPLSDPVNFREANPNIFGIQQKLPFPGKLRLKGEIASAEAKMAEARYRAKEREIIARVKNAYAGLFMAFKGIQIQSEHLELVKQTLRTAEIRYAVGKVPQQDVFKAQVAQSEV